MKFLIFFLFFQFSLLNSQIKLSDLDDFRSFTKPEEKSIIETGTKFCNDFFDENKNVVVSNKKNFKNFFLCKFSKKRNRFYIYMLSYSKEDMKSIKETCVNIIVNWPWIADHMDENLKYQDKDYLKGFYLENIFNNKILNFKNNFKQDNRLIKNEIDNFILENRDLFTVDNEKNNYLVEREIKKISKVYKKILTRDETNLDKVIKAQLEKIIRYKIFVNDTKNFISYSCNWKPGNGLVPYVKKEKFSEFENI